VGSNSGLSYPYGVAVDAAGDVFGASVYTNTVEGFPAGGGTPTTVGTGLNQPHGVAVGEPPASSTYGDSVTLQATVAPLPGGTAPTGAVTFTDDNNGTSTVLGSQTVSTPTAGTYTASLQTAALPVGANQVTASYLGDDNASTSPPYTVNVTPVPQEITFTSTPPADAFDGGSYTVSASGGGSGNPVDLTSATPAVCTVPSGATNSRTVSFVGGGTCEIDANQAGNTDYQAAPQATQSFVVSGDGARVPPGVHPRRQRLVGAQPRRVGECLRHRRQLRLPGVPGPPSVQARRRHHGHP
jgi:hypothetical protein